MKQKGSASLLVIGILVAAVLIGYGIYYFVHRKASGSETSNSSSLPYFLTKSTPTPFPSSQSLVHLADDPFVSIEKIKIMTILFVPKDVESPVDDKWRSLAQDWNKDVVSFWENVLDLKSNITFDTLPQTFKGEKDANEYDYNSVYQELWPQISTNSQLATYFNRQENEFLTLFVYVLSDSQHFYKDSGRATHISSQGATFGLFIGSMDNKFDLLDRNRGGVAAEEAHELGHALGLQHTTDDPNLVAKYLKGNIWTSACDLMLGKPYAQNKDWNHAKTLQELECIIPEQKELFFK